MLVRIEADVRHAAKQDFRINQVGRYFFSLRIQPDVYQLICIPKRQVIPAVSFQGNRANDALNLHPAVLLGVAELGKQTRRSNMRNRFARFVYRTLNYAWNGINSS
jgi:hypothetical protein